MRPAAHVAFVAAFLALVGCSHSPVSPSDRNEVDPAYELTERLETDHIIFRYSPGDYVESQRAEAFHRWATAELGVSMTRKVLYYKLRDREQMWRVLQSPYTGFAYVDPSRPEVWTYVPFLNHELVHIYSVLFAGWPTNLLVEGLAEAYMTDPYTNDFVPRQTGGTPLVVMAAQFKRDGRLFPLSSIASNSGWSANNPVVAYVEAGSFVRYVIDRFGMATFKAWWALATSNDTAAAVATKFQTVYGAPLGQVEADWLAWLDTVR
jgi:hypothetical protein